MALVRGIVVDDFQETALHQLPPYRRPGVAAQFHDPVALDGLVPRHQRQHVESFGVEPHRAGTGLDHTAKPGKLRPQPHHPAGVLRHDFVGTVVGPIPSPHVGSQFVDLLRPHAAHQARHRATGDRLSAWQTHEQDGLQNALRTDAEVGVACRGRKAVVVVEHG